jgi:hypothetical protein
LNAWLNGFSELGPNGSTLLMGMGLFVAGALLGGLIFGLYLGVMSWLGWLTNNGYSALALQDFKGFLRCKISPDGQLHAYFVAIDQVPKAWTLNEDQQPVWQPQDRPLASRVHDRFTLHPSNPRPPA